MPSKVIERRRLPADPFPPRKLQEHGNLFKDAEGGEDPLRHLQSAGAASGSKDGLHGQTGSCEIEVTSQLPTQLVLEPGVESLKQWVDLDPFHLDLDRVTRIGAAEVNAGRSSQASAIELPSHLSERETAPPHGD